MRDVITRGIRVCDRKQHRSESNESRIQGDNSTSRIITYTQTKNGIGYYYDKRRVASDGINTYPLDL